MPWSDLRQRLDWQYKLWKRFMERSPNVLMVGASSPEWIVRRRIFGGATFLTSTCSAGNKLLHCVVDFECWPARVGGPNVDRD